MKKQLIVAVLIFCIASVIFIGLARAQTTVLPGVNLGDDYEYTTYGYWSSTNSYASIPSDLVTANQTQAIEVRISAVNDTFVTSFTATYYTNGQPSAVRGDLNIQTGDVTNQPWPAIIGANLTSGELIHPLGTDGITINDTTTFEGRPTNEILITQYNSTSGLTDTVDRLFDQQTGMLVKEVDTETDDGTVSGYTSTSALTTLIASSPWNPQPVTITTQPPTTSSSGTSPHSSSDWIYYVTIAAVAVVVVVVAFLMLHNRQTAGRRKARRPAQYQPPPPPPPPPPK